jgi:CDGSH-type Zn-finger protein
MRIVVKTEKGPKQVGDKFICMCGLSKDQPFCDGSHKQTADEKDEETYLYTEEGREIVQEITVGEAGCCCGHGDEGCCGKGEHKCSHK